jgi:hypothetical protein
MGGGEIRRPFFQIEDLEMQDLKWRALLIASHAISTTPQRLRVVYENATSNSSTVTVGGLGGVRRLLVRSRKARHSH